jgi:pullulanase/glycogen debranching enzyme
MSVAEDTYLERERFAKTKPTGRSHPLGATVVSWGVNFSIFSRGASSVELLFFDRVEDGRFARMIQIDTADHRNYPYWHTFVPGVKPGQIYGFRVHKPFDAASDLRFDPSKLLLDPYGRATIVPKNHRRAAAASDGDNASTAMKSMVVDPALTIGKGMSHSTDRRTHDHLRDACAWLSRANIPCRSALGGDAGRWLGFGGRPLPLSSFTPSQDPAEGGEDCDSEKF